MISQWICISRQPNAAAKYNGSQEYVCTKIHPAKKLIPLKEAIANKIDQKCTYPNPKLLGRKKEEAKIRHLPQP